MVTKKSKHISGEMEPNGVTKIYLVTRTLSFETMFIHSNP